jgi:hypothetical protein
MQASYQLGHYEMQGPPGKRRSVFRVDVHLGECETPEDALAAWPAAIERLARVGREQQADKLEVKLSRLRSLS